MIPPSDPGYLRCPKKLQPSQRHVLGGEPIFSRGEMMKEIIRKKAVQESTMGEFGEAERSMS